LSERHAEALAHLLYGINEAGGFIQLTGEVGTGKTTIIRSLLEQLPAHADVALILNPRVTPAEFLLTICEELRIPVAEPGRGSVKLLMDLIGRRLLEQFVEQARAAGVRRVHLEVRDGNPAVQMYRRAGFRPAGRRPKYYRGSDGRQYDAITLAHAL